MKTKLLFILCLVLSNYLTAQNSWTLSNSGFEKGFCVTDFTVTKSNNFFAVGAKVTTTPRLPPINQTLQFIDHSIMGLVGSLLTQSFCLKTILPEVNEYVL